MEAPGPPSRGGSSPCGDLAVYRALEPCGPWTTAYFAAEWDVGPGESASFPTKWIGDDGRTLRLIFSGDDSFSVRSAQLVQHANK